MIAEFERDGMAFASALDYCPELLVKQGILTRRPPTAAEELDIAFGWRLAKEMGRLDVGQSVAVKESAALAVEAIEGTDRCIERAGPLCRQGGWTLVKVAKPQQDMRFDVPTIGVSTIQNSLSAKAKVLAIEAGKTIVIDQAGRRSRSPIAMGFPSWRSIPMISPPRSSGTRADLRGPSRQRRGRLRRGAVRSLLAMHPARPFQESGSAASPARRRAL